MIKTHNEPKFVVVKICVSTYRESSMPITNFLLSF
jgi:hypothetical protein